jgi:O-6-methylguanine DNA methyltransferase
MVEVSFSTLAGPSGPLTVAVTANGLVAAEWDRIDGELQMALARRLGEVRVAGPGSQPAQLLAAMLPVLHALLDGADAAAARVPVDLRDRPAFDQRVLAEVRAVGWGETASYGEIARRVGVPRAARAVGGALGRNPVALVIPCHRIIASDGTLGGYGGDGWVDRAAALERKRQLLSREGVTARIRDR